MKRGTIEHPKTQALAERLGLELLTAVGLLEALWHFTAKYARRGDVGRFTNQAIGHGVHWGQDADELIEGLVRSGWIDHHPEHRLVVHHWHDHADQAVRKSLGRAGEDFIRPDETAGQGVRTEWPARTAGKSGDPECPDKTASRPSAPIHSHSHSQSPSATAPRTSAGGGVDRPPPDDGHGQKVAVHGDGPDGRDALEHALVDRGVHVLEASKLVGRYEPDRIWTVIKHVDQKPDVRNRGGLIHELLAKHSKASETTEAGRAEAKIKAMSKKRRGCRRLDRKLREADLADAQPPTCRGATVPAKEHNQ